MPFSTLFFDLDDTLYPPDNGLWGAVRERMNEYMLERLHIPAEQVPLLRRQYFETYGTTLLGLQIHYSVDTEDFLAYVHDLPIERMVHPDPLLRPLLESLPQRKFIFTNADIRHARRVLAVLDLEGCFDGIVDVHVMQFQCKPNPQAYQAALDFAGEREAGHCVYLDDSPRNLAPARRLGFFTVLVSGPAQNGSAAKETADRSIATPHNLPDAMPELWQSPTPAEEHRYE